MITQVKSLITYIYLVPRSFTKDSFTKAGILALEAVKYVSLSTSYNFISHSFLAKMTDY